MSKEPKTERLSAEMARKLIKSIEDVEREEAEAMFPSTSSVDSDVTQGSCETSISRRSEPEELHDEAA